MSKRLVDRIPFAKILVIFSVIFVISLGLCGASVAFSSSNSAALGNGTVFVMLMILDGAVMVISGAGAFLTAIVWVIAAIASGPAHKSDDEVERQ
jgi:hypothetical protein